RDEKGTLKLDGKEIDYSYLRDFFVDELRKTGLYENEIKDFVDFWLTRKSRLSCEQELQQYNTNSCGTEKERIFFCKNVFKFAIIYLGEYDKLVKIETSLEYESIVRVIFIVMPFNDKIKLEKPVYPTAKHSKNALHEWGLIPYKIDVGNIDFTEGIEGVDIVEFEDNSSIRKETYFLPISILIIAICITVLKKRYIRA
ncbi:MAG: hypothetical protein AB1779_04325, partial [Candidatus Thermoplasmatota archaeon]